MKLFNVTPYLLLLEQENSNEETLSKANAEFVKEVYELQRAENDITIVLFQLQYLSCRLVILREHYRTAQKEHLICYSYIIGTLTYLEGMQAHCKFAYEIHPAGADVSTSISTQMDSLIPPSKISGLTQGMFVGSVADNFGERIEQKIFHCEIVVDAGKIAEEEKAYQKIPVITGFVDDDGVDHMKEMVQENYNRIKEDVKRIVADELERIASDPALKHLLELNK